jgi:hypothetical protein
MRSRTRTRLLVAQAALSLAALGLAGPALAQGASSPPAAGSVVYTPIRPAPAKRPAPTTSPAAPLAPARQPVPAVYAPSPSAQAAPPVLYAPIPSAASQRLPAPTAYTATPAVPEAQPAAVVPAPSPPAPPAPPLVVTPTPSIPAPPPVLYTPMPLAPGQRQAPPVTGPTPSASAQPTPTAPAYSAPVERPASPTAAAPSVPAETTARNDATIGEAVPQAPVPPRSQRLLGVTTDVGLPDGANLGLVVRPTSWIRLNAAGGTNSASLGFRGGLTAIPQWFWQIGPSFTLEAGYCRVGDVNVVLRSFFQVPSWMKDYAQQAGYTYYNAHLGLEFGRRNITGFIHAGGSYVDGTVRAPNPVLITSAGTSSTDTPHLIFGQDAKVQAYTLSAKVGLIVYFGGP